MAIIDELRGWWNKRTLLSCTFIVIILTLVGFFIAALTVWAKNTWVKDLLNFIGSIASLIGILIALIQNINTQKEVDLVKEISRSTRAAVEETRNSVKKSLNAVQVTKYCEKTKLIQELLSNEEFKTVLHLSRDLKEAIVELRAYLLELQQQEMETVLTTHILNLGKNISYLQSGLKGDPKKIKVGNMQENYEQLHTALVQLKSNLTAI